jgi:glycerol-3-phosphate acyltransferase PlsY
MSIYYLIIIGGLVGYLFGSIPFALIIGKVFYKTDVRNHGSGNLGSTNVGRTLGPIAGIIVMLLDIIKAGLPSLAMYKISELVLINNHEYSHQLVNLSCVYCVTGLMACFGHCHPCFANFKGGKGVASICGFLLFMNFRLFLVAILTYLVILLIFKIISVSSISAAMTTIISSFFPFFRKCYLFTHGEMNNELSLFIYSITLVMLALLLIHRHIPNIERLLKGKEKKFKFEHKNRKQ